VGRLPAPLSHAAVAWLNGRLFLLGGRLEGSTTDRVLRFDPTRAEAAPAGRLPSPVQNGAAAALGGAVYLVGGLSPAGTPLSAVVGLRPVPGA
jgi:N-acetylneuraminic acid mutarotase